MTKKINLENLDVKDMTDKVKLGIIEHNVKVEMESEENLLEDLIELIALLKADENLLNKLREEYNMEEK